jgi:hypothetical protein
VGRGVRSCGGRSSRRRHHRRANAAALPPPLPPRCRQSAAATVAFIFIIVAVATAAAAATLPPRFCCCCHAAADALPRRCWVGRLFWRSVGWLVGRLVGRSGRLVGWSVGRSYPLSTNKRSPEFVQRMAPARGEREGAGTRTTRTAAMGGRGGGRTRRRRNSSGCWWWWTMGGRGGRPHPSEKKFLRTLAVVDAPVPDENIDDGGGPEVAGQGRQGSQDKTARWWRQGRDEPPQHPHRPVRAEG